MKSKINPNDIKEKNKEIIEITELLLSNIIDIDNFYLVGFLKLKFVFIVLIIFIYQRQFQV